MANRLGNWKQWETLFRGAPKSLQMVTAAMKLKTLASWKKSYDQPSSVQFSRSVMSDSLWPHDFMANRWGNNGNSDRLFSWASKSLQMVTAAMKLITLALWKKSYDQPREHIKKQRHYFANKGPSKSRLWFFQWSCMDAEKAMAPHSSTPAWKTPWTEEPGRLQSMGSLRVRHDWATSF